LQAEALLLTKSIVSNYVKRKVVVENQQVQGTPLTIEFSCNQPSSVKTIPNRLLKELSSLTRDDDNDFESNDILDIAQCLVAVRPLNQKLAIQVLTKTLEKSSAKLDSDQEDSNLEVIYLMIKILGTLLCPNEFLKSVVDQEDLITKLSPFMDQKIAAQALAQIFIVSENDPNAANWVQRSILGPLKGQLFIKDLLKNLLNPCNQVRFWHLISLTKIFPNDQIYNVMLEAENIAPSVASCRERAKFLTNLSWDNPIVVKSDESARDGVFRFLLAQLAINFSLLWQPTLKAIETHTENGNNLDNMWTTWLELFKLANLKSAGKSDKDKTTSSQGSVDYCNLRNKLLLVLSESLGHNFMAKAEKHNVLMCHEFLEVFMRCETQSSDGQGLLAFMSFFAKFKNLQSMPSFEKVKSAAQMCLGHFMAKNRSAAMDFFLAAYKDLRPHKDILTELVDGKKWKAALISLPDEIAKSDNVKVSNMVNLVLAAKLRQTAREKRKAQMANRKFLVRMIFQVLGKDRALDFLHSFVKIEAPFLETTITEGVSVENAWDAVKKLSMIFDVLIISAKSAGGVQSVFEDILTVLKCQGRLLISSQKEQQLLLSKQRTKLMEHILMVIAIKLPNYHLGLIFNLDLFFRLIKL
jgi:hypothetical protein